MFILLHKQCFLLGQDIPNIVVGIKQEINSFRGVGQQQTATLIIFNTGLF